MFKVAQAYFQTQVVGSTQGELLLLLYDGAVKFLKQAKIKMAERDFAQKGILISKAMDVISELDGCLNVKDGGEIAQNLHNLYFFCNTRLLKANMSMDQGMVDEVVKILTGLKDAFSQVLKQGQNLTAPQAPRPPQPKTAEAVQPVRQEPVIPPQPPSSPQVHVAPPQTVTPQNGPYTAPPAAGRAAQGLGAYRKLLVQT